MKIRIKKRKILLAAAIVSLLIATGCGKGHEEVVLGLSEGQSDFTYIKSKGTFVVGITDFAPMDYLTDLGWNGFDAELAKSFADSLGVTLELKEIDWDEKTKLLGDGSIDCIWNGMTLTEKLQEEISCSNPYLSNEQVIVLWKAKMEQYNTVEAAQHLLFAVEAGSTGEALLKELKYRYTVYSTQMEALHSVSTKQTDAAVIDIIMASYYTSEEQEFGNLGFSISLNNEKICVGFRKNSDLTEKVNEFLKNAYEEGTIRNLAEKYGIEDAILN